MWPHIIYIILFIVVIIHVGEQFRNTYIHYIHMYVCMYVCMSCMYVCMYVHMYVCYICTEGTGRYINKLIPLWVPKYIYIM